MTLSGRHRGPLTKKLLVPKTLCKRKSLIPVQALNLNIEGHRPYVPFVFPSIDNVYGRTTYQEAAEYFLYSHRTDGVAATFCDITYISAFGFLGQCVQVGTNEVMSNGYWLRVDSVIRPLVCLCVSPGQIEYVLACSRIGRKVEPDAFRLVINPDILLPRNKTPWKGGARLYKEFLISDPSLKDIPVIEDAAYLDVLFGKARMPTFTSTIAKEMTLAAVSKHITEKVYQTQ
jgi:hypothetical protein